MIRCIASDMDGTLLNGRQKISKENREAILQAQSAGIEFVIATGRSYKEVQYIVKEAEIVCPVICTNGAEIRSENGDILSSFPLDKKSAEEIGDYLDEMGMFYEVYTNQGVYVKDYRKGIELVMNIFASAHPDFNKEKFRREAKDRIKRGRVRVVEDYQSLFEDPSIDILKLLTFSLNAEHLNQVNQKIKQWDIAVSSSGYDNLEITNSQAQKGIALEFFTKTKNIKMEETMAIGDSYNDLSMFAKAGLAVAMGNANAEIKKQCHQETDTNEQNGVAKVIYEILRVSNKR